MSQYSYFYVFATYAEQKSDTNSPMSALISSAVRFCRQKCYILSNIFLLKLNFWSLQNAGTLNKLKSKEA